MVSRSTPASDGDGRMPIKSQSDWESVLRRYAMVTKAQLFFNFSGLKLLMRTPALVRLLAKVVIGLRAIDGSKAVSTV